ncbi:hypothetical protein O3M35_012346 [Rhynocoris fuscipes]|uniref:RETREG1-3/ARL6IP-like N-terminal reticulon-homology domain-containing protein n=1 Tax=Rhynocoris fuscipes TaxID=488301 RepID=A0AAW1CTH2_9HEMI
MDYFKKFYRSAKTKLFRPKHNNVVLTEEQKLAYSLKPFERYLYKIQHIIKWEEPTESILYIILVNTLFWFLTYIQWKFYGLLFAILCSYIIHEAWSEHIWPEIRVPKENEKIMEKDRGDIITEAPEGYLTVPEISHYATTVKDALHKYYNRLCYLRATQPPVYCGIVSIACLVVAGIGSVISGIALVYLLTMAFMIIPGCIVHLLSPLQKEKLCSLINTVSYFVIPSEDSRNIDDYVPESTKENLVLLSQAGDNNERCCVEDLSTPSTDDSSLGDLMMPGYDESSVDTVESLMLPTIPQDSSEDTDSEVGALRFKSHHFNGDGSSTDEEISLVKDLVFPDVIQEGSSSSAADSTAATSSVVSQLGSGITQTVAGVLYKTFTSAVSRGSEGLTSSAGLRFQRASSETTADPFISKDMLDSDSEFEIIDSEDAEA